MVIERKMLAFIVMISMFLSALSLAPLADSVSQYDRLLLADPVMTISKEARNIVAPGEIFTYWINYTNTGNGDAGDVVITDTYPSGITFISAIPSPTLSNNIWMFGTILSGGSDSILITVQSDIGFEGTLVNFAELTYDNSTGFPQTPVSDIAITHCGSGPVFNIGTGENFDAIQDAIDDNDTADGHTILVSAGTYFENLVVGKSLRLMGEDRNMTTIDGSGNGDVILITADGATVSGFNITNSGTGPGDSGIELDTVQDCIVDGNTLYDNGMGVYFTPSHIYQNTTIQLTSNTFSDVSPKLNDNEQMTWYGGEGDNEIFFWNGTATSQITSNSVADSFSQINNNGEICWQGIEGADADIFFWDGANTTVMSTNPSGDASPMMNDNGKICWYGYDGTDNEIYFWNGLTVTKITSNTRNDYYPQINNNGKLCWYYYDGTDNEIFFWDGITRQLTSNTKNEYSPLISDNGYVCWAGYDVTDLEIYLWNGISTIKLTDNTRWDSAQRINNNGHLTWAGDDGSDNEIFYWDGSTITQLTNNTYADNSPQINDKDEICWSSNDGEKYYINLWNGSTSTRLFESYWTINSPVLNENGHVAWYGSDNSDNEIYYYGLNLLFSSHNYIVNNDIIYNDVGIYIWNSTENSIYQNNFIYNSMQAYDHNLNQWNGYYPLGGNYWSNYTGTDALSGVNQNESGSDGIGDTPHIFDTARDMYPLTSIIVNPYRPVHNIDKDTFYPTIQCGVNDADMGDHIEVASGMYEENVIISKGIHLKGMPNSTVDANGRIGFVVYNPDELDEGITIEGFSILNCSCGIYMVLNRIMNLYNDTNIMIGGIDFNNNTIQAKSYGIFTLLEDIGYYMYDSASLSIGAINMNNNTLDCIDDGINFKMDGIGMAMYDNSSCHMNDVSIQGNTVNSSSYGIAIDLYGFGLSMHNNSVFEMGYIYICGNEIFNASSGIETYIMSFGDTLYDAASFSMKDIRFTENILSTYSDGTYLDISGMVISLFDNASFVMGDILVTNNEFSNEYGMDFYCYDFAYDLSGYSSFSMGDIRIENNNLMQSISGGIYIELSYFGNELIDSATCQMGSIEICNNDITNAYYALDIEMNDFASYMYDYSSFNMNCVNITHNSIINADYDGINCYFDDIGYPIYDMATFSKSYMNFSYNEIDNCDDGIYVISRDDNIFNKSFYYNTIQNCSYGMRMNPASNCFIHHNNFINNLVQAYDSTTASHWDDGYPSGGNYFSDYPGSDLLSGPYQNIPGSDGIGDTPYTFNVNSRDNYPLMTPWTNASRPVRNLDTGEEFFTIQSAINDIDTRDGHRLEAGPGIYYENIVVHKSLSITGAGANVSVIDGRGLGNGITIYSDYASVSGFAITNCSSEPEQTGIHILADHVNVHDNTVSGNSKGILLGMLSFNTTDAIHTSAEFDAGIKSNSSENYEIETRTDNPAMQADTISLGSYFGDSFTCPSTDASTWKWGKTNPDGVINATVKTEEITAGTLHLYAKNTGVRGGAGVNLNQQITGNIDMRIRMNGVSAATVNQNEYISFKLWQNSNNYALLSFGYDTSNYIQPQLIVNGVNNYVTNHDGTDVDRLIRIVRNETNLAVFYKLDGTADITSDVGWTLSLQCAVGTATGPMWAKLYVYTSQFANSEIHGYFDNFYVEEGTIASGFRTNGTWTSAIQSMSGAQRLINTTVEHNNATSSNCIDRIEWLQGTIVKATYELDIISGSSTTITETDLSSGSFDSIIGNYQIRITFAGGGNGSAVVSGVTLQYWNPAQGISNALIIENSIESNDMGLELFSSSGNAIYHNNFINNTIQANDDNLNSWDDGYPSGGNFWSDYDGADLMNGPDQNLTGSDGIGDLPYTAIQSIAVAHDNYPLMEPWAQPPPIMFSINLTLGWNLISIPLIPVDPTNIESLLSSISGCWNVVKWYDSDDYADHWKSYRVGSSQTDMARIDNTMGIWLHVTNSSEDLVILGDAPITTSILLNAGWNLVGVPSSSADTVVNVLAGTGFDRIECFDPATPYIREMGLMELMTPGNGYWVHLPADTIWIVDW